MSYDENRLNYLLERMRANLLSPSERGELNLLLDNKRNRKQGSGDIWGLIVLLGILYFLSKK